MSSSIHQKTSQIQRRKSLSGSTRRKSGFAKRPVLKERPRKKPWKGKRIFN
jgi:hypothetical protein